MKEITIKGTVLLVLAVTLLMTLLSSSMLTAENGIKIKARGHCEKERIYLSYMRKDILRDMNEPNNLGNKRRRNETKVLLYKEEGANKSRGKVKAND